MLSPANLAQIYAAASGVNTYPTVGGTPYTYDTAGMMTSDGVRNYLYDEAGHQTRTSLVSDATTYAVDRYDALGQRFFHYRGIPAAADPERTEYTDGIRPEIVWEEIRSTAEGSSTPTTTNQRYYVLGPNPDEHLIYIDKPSGAAVVRYPHNTKRGDVVAVAKLGLAEAKFKYGPFGESTDATGTVYHFRFTGQRVDDWTGLYHFKARAYSPTLGRFLQPDPIGYGVGPNIYTYCGNDPYNCVDPTGLQDAFVGGLGTAAIIGTACKGQGSGCYDRYARIQVAGALTAGVCIYGGCALLADCALSACQTFNVALIRFAVANPRLIMAGTNLSLLARAWASGDGEVPIVLGLSRVGLTESARAVGARTLMGSTMLQFDFLQALADPKTRFVVRLDGLAGATASDKLATAVTRGRTAEALGTVTAENATNWELATLWERGKLKDVIFTIGDKVVQPKIPKR